ncbi:MAG: hypothetical protein MRERV_32c046 [Mycoplasmataceae bacterium RV_VA103A]|nr:MAG: hypothetical protein MRERV_32c046 [Mycoplasmataceae bacterium RV_VA103A]
MNKIPSWTLYGIAEKEHEKLLSGQKNDIFLGMFHQLFIGLIS